MGTSKKKYNLKRIGTISVLSPLPMVLVTVFWFWILFFGIGMGMLGYTNVPDWMLIVGLLPLLFSPCFAVFGIVIGIVKRKQQHSLLCIILSVAGLLINFAMMFGMVYLGYSF